jgi:hypothetical protein
VVVATSVVVVAGGTQTGSGSRNTDVVVLATVEVVEEGFVDVVGSATVDDVGDGSGCDWVVVSVVG